MVGWVRVTSMMTAVLIVINEDALDVLEHAGALAFFPELLT
jgi:hypothetical protein